MNANGLAVSFETPTAISESTSTGKGATNARTRMTTAAFPVTKTLDELDRSACSIPGPTLDYLASLEWITAWENLFLVGWLPAAEPDPGSGGLQRAGSRRR
jgi:hypothetical protein